MPGMTEMKEMTRDDWEDLCVSGRSTAQEFWQEKFLGYW